MAEESFCCGQIPKQKKQKEEKNILKNPVVKNGTEVIYLGTGGLKIEGKVSGLTYYASDHQRRFIVDPDDLSKILKMRNFILKP